MSSHFSDNKRTPVQIYSDIPQFTRQHGRNSVLFRRPRHFEGTLATTLARFKAASFFLMGISERESLPNKPQTIDALKANFTKEIQAVTADVLARTFQNMARRVQSCLYANGGHFQHMRCHISHTTNVLLFKSRCNSFIGFRIIKEMLGLVGSETLCIMCMWSTMIFLTPLRQGTTPQILKLKFPVYTTVPKQKRKKNKLKIIKL
jgi:hypothetical protein